MSFLQSIIRYDFYIDKEIVLNAKDNVIPKEIIEKVEPFTDVKKEISTIEITDKFLNVLTKEYQIMRDKINILVTKM